MLLISLNALRLNKLFIILEFLRAITLSNLSLNYENANLTIPFKIKVDFNKYYKY